MNKKLIITFSLFSVLVCCLYFSACNVPVNGPNRLELTDLEGNPVDLSEMIDDKMIFMNFWATWCGPCVKELPSMQNASRILRKQGYKFILVSDEPIEKIKRFASGQKYDFTYLVSTKSLKWYGIFSIPHTNILKRGEVSASFQGAKDWSSKESIELLKNLKK